MFDDHNFFKPEFQNHFQSLKSYFTVTKAQHYYPIYYLLNINIFRHAGTSPITGHLINLLLFSTCAVLFYSFLKLILKNATVALISTVLFILHPINSFTIQYITANFIFVNAACQLMALIFLWRGIEGTMNQRISQFCAMLLFLLALLSFEGAVLFPLYLMAMLLFIKKISVKETLFRSGPFLLVTLIYVLMYMKFTNHNVGMLAGIQALDLNIFNYIDSFARLIFWYLSNIFLPFNIVFIYNIFPNDHRLTLISFAFISILVFLVFRIFKKDEVSFGITWFLIGFILVAVAMFGHFYNGLVIEPHWLFFPSLGLFLIGGIFLTRLKSIFTKSIHTIVLFSVFIYFFIHTQSYNILTNKENTYAKYWVEKSPQNYIAIMSLAAYYNSKKEYELALEYFYQAYPTCRYDLFKANFKLGEYLFELKSYEEAKTYLTKALEYNPNSADAYHYMGQIFHAQGNQTESIKYLNKSKELDHYSHKSSL